MAAYSIRLAPADRAAIRELAETPAVERCRALAVTIVEVMDRCDARGGTVELTSKILRLIRFETDDAWDALAVILSAQAECEGFPQAGAIRRFFSWLGAFIIFELRQRLIERPSPPPAGPMN